MSQPAESEGDESRTRCFANKRAFAVAQEDSSSGSSSNKRSRRSRNAPQNVRDFVPMGGSFSSTHQLIDIPDSDDESGEESSIASVANPESYPTDTTAMNQDIAYTQDTTGGLPALGQNRLASGFSSSTANGPAATEADGRSPQTLNGQSISYSTTGESPDDAIQISDDGDTEMEEESEDGGMMINLEDQNDNTESEVAAMLYENKTDLRKICHFRVTGWAQGNAKDQPDHGYEALFKMLKNMTAFDEIVEHARVGDDMIISVSPRAANAVRGLNNTKFHKAGLRIEDLTNEERSIIAAEVSNADLTKVHQLRISGWTQTKVAQEEDGGIRSLSKFLEKKARQSVRQRSATDSRSRPNCSILESSRTPEALIISVHYQNLPIFEALDGCRFAKKRLVVQAMSGEQPPKREEIEVSEDGEVGEEDEHVVRCNECGKLHYKGECAALRKVKHLSGQDVQGDAHAQLQDDLDRSTAAPSAAAADAFMSIAKASQPFLRLGDLSPDQFEDQVRYTLFHLDREKIDPNRLVICTACLSEGHLEHTCPESICVHCGAQHNHSSRRCPGYRRCLRCRERGHDIDTCMSKLKDSAPCDFCGSPLHFEDTCQTRFFPPLPSVGANEIKLWISCCICASKTHFVGDCPEQQRNDQAEMWSLRLFDPGQITNLSLESGTKKLEKEAENRGMRPQGLKIKGRADAYIPKQPVGDDVDEPFIRPPIGNRQDNSPRRANHIRFNNGRGDRRHDDRSDDFYRPSARDEYRPPPQEGRRADRYEPSFDSYRDAPGNAPRGDKWYATDSFGQQRRRSRSPNYPPQSRAAAGRSGGYDNNGPPPPPLPREPLPLRSSAPASNLGSKPSGRAAGAGGDTYRPMPSAAKQAWNRGRL